MALYLKSSRCHDLEFRDAEHTLQQGVRSGDSCDSSHGGDDETLYTLTEILTITDEEAFSHVLSRFRTSVTTSTEYAASDFPPVKVSKRSQLARLLTIKKGKK